MLDTWAARDKTIIICGAGNHKGVVDCFNEIVRTGSGPGFMPAALFREDEQSMNGMATACGVIVPQKYWDATLVTGDAAVESPGDAYWVHTPEVGTPIWYPLTHSEGQFISHIKGYRLA